MNDTPYFINLSNHPSEKWGETQTRAAKKIGSIVDLPFPNIAPTMDIEDIEVLAQSYVDKVLNMAEKKRLRVHVMGEMCFTFRFVSIMLQHGVPCYASTAARVVTEKENGVKEAIFQFIRFRQYK